jgi:hypothetical protein
MANYKGTPEPPSAPPVNPPVRYDECGIGIPP